MTDMQKVRVSLVDADGVTHEVVGYAKYGNPANGVYPSTEEGYGEDFGWELWTGEAAVTPIVQLPTGLGAVVDYREEGEEPQRFVYVGDGWWLGSVSEARSDWLAARPFTVLSEGAK